VPAGRARPDRLCLAGTRLTRTAAAFHYFAQKKRCFLNIALTISSLLIALLVAALIREVRLRRALRVLLRRLVTKRRNK
jgi:hypothetical protein